MDILSLRLPMRQVANQAMQNDGANVCNTCGTPLSFNKSELVADVDETIFFARRLRETTKFLDEWKVECREG